MYRYIVRESCSQFDSLPLTSLTRWDATKPATVDNLIFVKPKLADKLLAAFPDSAPRGGVLDELDDATVARIEGVLARSAALGRRG